MTCSCMNLASTSVPTGTYIPIQLMRVHVRTQTGSPDGNLQLIMHGESLAIYASKHAHYMLLANINFK